LGARTIHAGRIISPITSQTRPEVGTQKSQQSGLTQQTMRLCQIHHRQEPSQIEIWAIRTCRSCSNFDVRFQSLTRFGVIQRPSIIMFSSHSQLFIRFVPVLSNSFTKCRLLSFRKISTIHSLTRSARFHFVDPVTTVLEESLCHHLCCPRILPVVPYLIHPFCISCVSGFPRSTSTQT
jgi:hypothetical protein